MDQEQLDRAAVARGQKAEVELELLDEAFDQLKAAAIEEWLNTSSGQVEKRERLHQVAAMTDAVRAALMKIVNDGAYARVALAQHVSLTP